MELRQLQLNDQSVGVILRAKEEDKRPSSNDVKWLSMTARRLNQLWERLEVLNGTLWRRYDDSSGKKNWLQLNCSSHSEDGSSQGDP